VLYSVVHNGPGRTVRWTVALFLFRWVQTYVQWIKRPECTRHIENPTEPIWLRFNRCDQRNAGTRVDFAYQLRSDVSPSDGDTGYPFVCTTIRIRYMERSCRLLCFLSCLSRFFFLVFRAQSKRQLDRADVSHTCSFNK
jgi:hypothetical protein